MIKNHALSPEPPGWKQRLATAFTSNVAETRDDHPWPELRAPVFRMKPDVLWQRSRFAGELMGWKLEAKDDVARTQHWVITTPLLRFKDDLMLEVRDVGEGHSTLYIRSSSRLGSGDLGANVQHVRRMLAEVSGEG